jgi:uncharacterized protein YwgA
MKSIESRNEEGLMLVERGPIPIQFEEESLPFKSMESALMSLLSEVYAPVAYDDPAQRRRLSLTVSVCQLQTPSPPSMGKEGIMQVRDLLLLAYRAFSPGRIPGKTNLQKRIYLLGAMLGYSLGFEPHHFGPYSSEVAEANSELRSLGYLRESVSSRGEVGPQGIRKARYDYELTEDGRRIAEQKKKERPDEWKEMQMAVRRIERAGPIDYDTLAIAAKVYFLMVQEGGKAKLKAIQESAREFKWSITEKELRRACEFLKKLGLATVKEIEGEPSWLWARVGQVFFLEFSDARRRPRS